MLLRRKDLFKVTHPKKDGSLTGLKATKHLAHCCLVAMKETDAKKKKRDGCPTFRHLGTENKGPENKRAWEHSLSLKKLLKIYTFKNEMNL